MRFLAGALMFLFGLVAFAGMHELRLAPNWLVVLSIYALLQTLAILAHELGHALAARRRGATLEVISVAWWEYEFRTRRLAAAREFADRELGGFVIYSFGEREPTRQDDAFIAAAGPAANLLLALLALVAALSLSFVHDRPSARPIAIVEASTNQRQDAPHAMLPKDGEPRASLARYDAQRRRDAVTRWLHGMALVLAVLSLGMALTNLLPFRGSDGDRLWWALSRKRTWGQGGGA